MNLYTFRTPNGSVACYIDMPATTSVVASNEADARHAAMLKRWGVPGGTRLPFSSEPNRYSGEGLMLESVAPCDAASPQE